MKAPWRRTQAWNRRDPFRLSTRASQVDPTPDSLGQLADLLRSVESDLADLTPPADLASTYDSYLSGMQEVAATTDDLAEAMTQVPPGQVSPELRTIGKELSQQSEESARIAAELGFTVCS